MRRDGVGAAHQKFLSGKSWVSHSVFLVSTCHNFALLSSRKGRSWLSHTIFTAISSIPKDTDNARTRIFYCNYIAGPPRNGGPRPRSTCGLIPHPPINKAGRSAQERYHSSEPRCWLRRKSQEGWEKKAQWALLTFRSGQVQKRGRDVSRYPVMHPVLGECQHAMHVDNKLRFGQARFRFSKSTPHWGDRKIEVYPVMFCATGQSRTARRPVIGAPSEVPTENTW